MSLQESCFNTAHVMDNEIVKAADFEFAFENLVTNVSKVAQMMLESNQDFVINGKVLPYSGMNVQVSPIFGVCKSTGIPFGRTETAVMEYGFEESASGRIDIIEVKGDWETYDNQQRAFNDPDTDVKTYQYVDTKKLMRPVYKIKKGVEGSAVAPELDKGYVKLAEVVIRANNSTITAADIKNITSDIAGVDNEGWTTQADITYNIGYISDVNERFREQHKADGTHKDNVINSDSLDIGVNAKQINGSVLPIGGNVSVPTQTVSTTESIHSVIVKVAAVVTSLYNVYLKYGTYGFKGTLAISDIANSSDILTKPLTLSADGSGQAFLKIGTNTVLTINENGRLTTNGYTASNDNDIVTKKVTDAIIASVSALEQRVTEIEILQDTTEYINGTLSAARYSYSTLAIVVATTADITLSGAKIIDGVTVTNGQFVLVKNQTDKKQNGIYTYSSSSSWSRVTDANTPNKIKGKIFEVTKGTTNAGKLFYLPKVNFTNPNAFDSDDIEFLEYFGSIAEMSNKVAVRDSNGRLHSAASSSGDDVVTRTELEANGALRNAILDAVYPVGSLYWSSKNTDPGTLFGGTWTQIKDKFIWAKGDSDTVNAEGGAKTVTLTTAQLPSHTHGMNNHTHTLTPSGSISVTTNPTFTGTAVTSAANNRGHIHSIGAHAHSLNNHTHSLNSHTHSLNSHTHKFTPSGEVGKHSHTLSIAGTATSSGAHTHRLLVCTGKKRNSISYKYPANTDSDYAGSYTQIVLSGVSNYYDKPDNSWTSYPTIDDTSGYSRYGNWGKQNNNSYKRTLLESDGSHTHSLSFTTNSISEVQPSFSGTEGTTGAASGNTGLPSIGVTGQSSGDTGNSKAFDSGAESQNHTHSVTAAGNISGGAYKFTGTEGTTSKASGNTTATGSGSAVDIMPPYVVKYCWERTA